MAGAGTGKARGSGVSGGSGVSDEPVAGPSGVVVSYFFIFYSCCITCMTNTSRLVHPMYLSHQYWLGVNCSVVCWSC